MLEIMRALMLTVALMAGFMLISTPTPSLAEANGAPGILVLGDSQLTFGSGAAFVDLFQNMAGSCGIKKDTSVGVIGVRSSTLTAWTGISRKTKSAICDVDPKWNANAGAYGSLSQGKNPYIQIGRGDQFQFCKAGVSPLQSVFNKGYYAPDLVVMFLLGNATDRWAGSAQAAKADVQALIADLPANQPCIFMTTAPPYGKSVVKQRLKAQQNIERAFAQSGRQCSFVRGFTTETIAANQGNAQHFRRSKSDKVRDPYHPTEQAARAFLKLERDALCSAARTQLGKN
jgi:hypothetical protein